MQLDNAIGQSGSSKLIAAFMQDDIAQNQSDDFVKSDRVSLDWTAYDEIANGADIAAYHVYRHSAPFTNPAAAAEIALAKDEAKAGSSDIPGISAMRTKLNQ